MELGLGSLADGIQRSAELLRGRSWIIPLLQCIYMSVFIYKIKKTICMNIDDYPQSSEKNCDHG